MNSKRFCEERRIVVARQLKIPPDDLDLESIYECYYDAIKKMVLDGSEYVVLDPKNKKEEKSVISYNGSVILGKIFTGDEPFKEWVQYRIDENQEDSAILKDIDFLN